MAWSKVQSNLAIHGNSVPGSITLGTTPTVGNLLIAFIGCNIAGSSITIGTGWTLFDEVLTEHGGTVNMTCLYRYVQMGDTTALPAFWSAGSTYWSHDVYEITSPAITGSWDSDFLASVTLHGAQGIAALPQYPIFANGFAITSGSRYNGSANWSINGSWTLNDTANNAGNFGSAGGASRVISNGDTIDGTWSGGGTDQTSFGSVLVLFTDTQPTGGVYPRHVWRSAPGSGVPGSFTMPWTPKVGSLLIAYLGWRDGTTANPTIGGSWTDWVDASLSTKMLLGLYRYVQGGDTAALPALVTSGSTFTTVTIIELDGGSGTFSTDHASDKTGGQTSGATLTTTADTTTANNQFALLAFNNYNASALASTTGFTNYLVDETDFGDYGSWFVAFEFLATAGSTVQGTITPGSTSNPQTYIQSIFNQGIGAQTFSKSDTEAASAAETETAHRGGASSDTEAGTATETETAHRVGHPTDTEAATATDAEVAARGALGTDTEAVTAADVETAVLVAGGANVFVVIMG